MKGTNQRYVQRRMRGAQTPDRKIVLLIRRSLPERERKPVPLCQEIAFFFTYASSFFLSETFRSFCKFKFSFFFFLFFFKFNLNFFYLSIRSLQSNRWSPPERERKPIPLCQEVAFFLYACIIPFSCLGPLGVSANLSFPFFFFFLNSIWILSIYLFIPDKVFSDAHLLPL